MNPCAHELEPVLDSYSTTVVLLIVYFGKSFVSARGKRTKLKCCDNIPDAGVKNTTYTSTKSVTSTSHDCISNSKYHM